MSDTTQTPDGTVLHFLKELPAWCVILMFLIVFIGVWIYQPFDFIPRIIDGLVAAMLTSIVGARRSGSTNIDTVQTDSVNADSMDQSTINTSSVNVAKATRKTKE